MVLVVVVVISIVIVIITVVVDVAVVVYFSFIINLRRTIADGHDQRPQVPHRQLQFLHHTA